MELTALPRPPSWSKEKRRGRKRREGDEGKGGEEREGGEGERCGMSPSASAPGSANGRQLF